MNETMTWQMLIYVIAVFIVISRKNIKNLVGKYIIFKGIIIIYCDAICVTDPQIFHILS